MHALALQFAASLAHETFQITHGPAEGVLRAARRTGPSIGPSAITVGDALRQRSSQPQPFPPSRWGRDQRVGVGAHPSWPVCGAASTQPSEPLFSLGLVVCPQAVPLLLWCG